MVMRVFLALGLALVLMAAAAWGQGPGPPANGSFRVSWEPRTTGVIPTIQGNVRNDSAVWVTDVRLQVEGLDAGDRPMGERVAWALGNIVPGGESSFVVESVPGAVSYRIAVVSFAVVSVVEAP
jgi:hypothetical protein